MISVDPRAGSKDIIDYLPRHMAELRRLEYGDCAWLGNGKDGVPVTVGLELKTVNDVLSCIGSGRFAGRQLPGLLQSYQVVYFVIEGEYRASREGILEVPIGKGWLPSGHSSRRWMWRDLENWLTTMETVGGVRIRKTFDKRETGRLIQSLYGWWTEKRYDEHRSLMAFDESGGNVIRKPGLVERVAKEFPNVGWSKAHAAAEKFSSVFDMVMASEDDWEEIEGVGKTIAGKVVAAVHGRKA